MVFRLPTHLESFVPPPSEQFQQSRSWSGVLTLTFSSNSPNGFEDIYVAAAETDGDKYVGPLCSSTAQYSHRGLWLFYAVEWTYGLRDCMST